MNPRKKLPGRVIISNGIHDISSYGRQNELRQKVAQMGFVFLSISSGIYDVFRQVLIIKCRNPQGYIANV
jgi:hypothetical protein